MAEQDLLERAKREIRDRLEELYPLVEERGRLRAVLEALEGGEGQKRASRRAARQRGRPTTSRRAGRGERRTQLHFRRSGWSGSQHRVTVRATPVAAPPPERPTLHPPT